MKENKVPRGHAGSYIDWHKSAKIEEEQSLECHLEVLETWM